MKTHLTTLAKSLALAFAAIAVFTLSGGVARADEVTLTGSTVGFSNVPQLTFTGTSLFSGTTALGIGSLSGSNNLGTLFLSTDPTQLVAGAFSLGVTFTSPLYISGGQSASYLAIIEGSVSPNIDQGGVNLHFGPTQIFSFTDGNNISGSFSFTVADLFVQSGQAANLTAGFTGQQQTTIPEPATLLLLGT